MRLVITQLADVEPAQVFEAIGPSALFEEIQLRKLQVVQRNDDLARLLVGDPSIHTEAIHLITALGAKRSLERTRLVIESGVNDPRVVAGLVCREPILGLKHDYCQPVAPQ